MTLIAGTVIDGLVYMAGDRALSIEDTRGNQSKTIMGSPKIWQSGIMLIGGAGDLAATQAIQFGCKPLVELRKDPLEYLSTDFVANCKSAIAEAGIRRRPWELLVALASKLYVVDRSGVIDAAGAWSAVGSAAGMGLCVLESLAAPRNARDALRSSARMFKSVANNSMEVSESFDFFEQDSSGNITSEKIMQTLRSIRGVRRAKRKDSEQ